MTHLSIAQIKALPHGTIAAGPDPDTTQKLVRVEDRHAPSDDFGWLGYAPDAGGDDPWKTHSDIQELLTNHGWNIVGAAPAPPPTSAADLAHGTVEHYRNPEDPNVLTSKGAAAVIYGYSDDLVEVGGDVREEFNAWERDIRLDFSDNISVEVSYTKPGVWRIHVLSGHDKVILDKLPTETEHNNGRYTDYLWILREKLTQPLALNTQPN